MADIQNLSDTAQESLWAMIAGASVMVKFVLIILLAFSVLSWAIIIYKYRILRKMEKESVSFLEFFWHKKQFAPIFEASGDYQYTPLARLFAAGYKELLQTRALRCSDTERPVSKGIGTERSEQSIGAQKRENIPFGVGEIDSVQRVLKKAISTEISRMEKAVTFLATTGNTTPFIGLFGTVWGIMNSFRGIGLRGSASLAVVAPGISEALITTAMGLIAAIPAVVAYNHFVTRINRMAVEMENFAADFLNIVEKELMKERK